MMSELVLFEKTPQVLRTPDQLEEPFAALAEAAPIPSHKNPARFYLETLKTGGGREGMESQLRKVALTLGFFDIEQKTLKTTGELKTKAVGNIDLFPWHALDYGMVEKLKSRLAEAVDAEEMSLRTARLIQVGVRSVVNTAFNLELIDSETLIRVKNITQIKGEPGESGRALSREEVQALVDVCRQELSIRGVRDKAILALGYGCGLRRNEMAKLELRNYKRGTNTLWFRGKGRKDATLPMSTFAVVSLEEWLDLRGRDEGPIWHAISRDNKINRTEGMTTQTIYDLILKRCKQAGIAPATPHDLRRTFITNFSKIADMATTSYVARHVDINTTAGYIKDKENEAVEAMKKLWMPT